MFKMGGKANSQGTGITSGLDEKVNMAIGGGVIKGQNMGARECFQEPQPDFSSMDIKDLMDYRTQNIDKQMSGLDSMKDIIRLQALGNLATNVLPNIESGGFTAVTDFLKDPMTTQTAIQGLTGLKKVDLKGKEFEAERGELLAIVNKKDTATLSGLSALNSNNGKPFFQEGGILPVGGITPPQSIGPDANNIIDSLRGVLKEEVGAIQIVNNVVDTENQLSAENTLVDRGSF